MNRVRTATDLPQKKNRQKKRVYRVLTTTGASALAMLLLEAGLRAFAPLASRESMLWLPDGHVMGRPAPNQVLRTPDGCEIRINNLGFRGPTYAWKPSPGTLRLAAFGGSSTFGYAAAGTGRSWPERLQSYMSDALEMPVEVINLGLPGYDAFNSNINYMSLGRVMNPHVVLMYHTWNDVKFFRRLGREPVVSAKVIRNKFWLQRMALETQIGRHVDARLRRMTKQVDESPNTSLKGDEEVPDSPVVTAAFDWERQNFIDFVSLARAGDALPVLITQATLAHPDNLHKQEYRPKIRADWVRMSLPILCQTWVEVNSLIRAVAEEKGAVLVDGYRAVPHNFEYLIDHVHLTDKGRDLLARTITDELLRDTRFLDVARRVRAEGKAPNATMLAPKDTSE